MSVIRIRRSDSIDLVTSPISHQYRMASPHLFTVRRVLSWSDLSMTTNNSKGMLDTSSHLYGLSGSANDYSLNRHKYYKPPPYHRPNDYTTSRRPYFRDYGHRKHWGDYGRPPYLAYFARPTPSSSFQWWYYPTSYYYPRITRTDYLDSHCTRRYREPYYIRSQLDYNPRYRRWPY